MSLVARDRRKRLFQIAAMVAVAFHARFRGQGSNQYGLGS